MAGTWLFGERLPADPAKLGLRLAGIALAAVVVVVLSRRPASTETEPAAVPDAEPADGAAPMMGAA